MKNRKNILRASLPWVLAWTLCAAVILLTIGIVLSSMSGQMMQEAKRKDMVSQLFPGNPLSNQLMSTLAMMPNMKSAAPLVASMIENHEDARPHQSGLREALVVFEMIVEGDISRFLALFRTDRLPSHIGPVRSLRPHFISVIRGYKPLLLHAGGSQIAYEALGRFSDIPNHDAIRYDGETYERDPNAEAPHNLFMRRAPLQSVLEQKNIQENTIPLFPTEKIVPKGGEKAEKIFLNFGSPLHDVTYTYKKLQGLVYSAQHGVYLRSIENAERQAVPKNVVVLETYIDGYNQPGYVPWTQTFGDGAMLLFRSGKVYRGTWKRERAEPFQFLDSNGEAIPLEPGQVWITMLPSLTQVEWE